MALPQAHRLKSNRDFGRVHRQGKRASTRHLAMRALKLAPPPKGKSKGKPLKTLVKGQLAGNLTDPLSERSLTDSSTSAGGDPPALLLQGKNLKQKGIQQPLCPDRPSQFGISISRKVHKRAVVRNRIKRQLKAIIRRYLPKIAPGWRVVIVVRPSAVECSFDDFLRELDYLLKKLEIVT